MSNVIKRLNTKENFTFCLISHMNVITAAHYQMCIFRQNITTRKIQNMISHFIIRRVYFTQLQNKTWFYCDKSTYHDANKSKMCEANSLSQFSLFKRFSNVVSAYCDQPPFTQYRMLLMLFLPLHSLSAPVTNTLLKLSVQTQNTMNVMVTVNMLKNRKCKLNLKLT